jgi:glutathione S-transferase
MKSFALLTIAFSSPVVTCFVPVLDSRKQPVLKSTTSLEAMTLFGSQGSRSPLVNWGALESGVPLTIGNLVMNPHPFKQIPCLTDDGDVMVFESGAILQYVYSKSKAFESDSPKRRAAITSWISWANASLDPICFLETPEGKVYDTGMKNPNKRLFTLDAILGKNEFLVEGGFSLADVAVASYLLYVPQFFQGIDLTRYPNIVRYMRQCAERPAYGEAFTPRVQSYLVSSLSVQEESGAEGEEKKKFFGMF